MEWLDHNAWAAWLALALALGAIEAASADLFFLMLAGGAASGALAAVLGAPLAGQVAVAAVVAVALLGFVRPAARRRMMRSIPADPIGLQGYVGREARVTAEVTADDGRVRLNGEEWSARVAEGGLPLPVDTRVRVVYIHGATAVVAPVQDRTLPPNVAAS